MSSPNTEPLGTGAPAAHIERPPPPYHADTNGEPKDNTGNDVRISHAEDLAAFEKADAEHDDALLVEYDTGELRWDTDLSSAGRVKVDLSAGPELVPDSLGDGEPAPESGAPDKVHETAVDPLNSDDCPPLNIVIFIVGSRGDVQPYLALALALIKARRHRVRIATHSDFDKLVTDARADLPPDLKSNLDFFSIGGDPHQLMAYMVRNPGLVPGLSAMTNGDIKAKRTMVKTMLGGCYRACFTPNEATGAPFAADAIISNPPAFANIHVAEAMGIPLIMSFTMPWTPTTAFPHPLVKAENESDETSVNNFSSFILADALMWQGLGDVINAFRHSVLRLRPLHATSGPLALERLKVPVTYAWSEALLPKPVDWRDNIDVVGFYTMPAREKPEADPAIAEFLKAGDPPIYIGFGSVVVQKPEELTRIIISAVSRAGVRAIVSAGWADLGAGVDIPDSVYIAKGNVAHDWLFAGGRVAAVCHHGGAGTTAAGLREGVPTIIVPFFGDQWFWGNAVAHAGAGPTPIPHAELTVDNLTEAIKVALAPKTAAAAQKLGKQIRAEQGTVQGTQSLHKHLPLLNLRCAIDPKRAAIWYNERLCLRLSGAAAAVVIDAKKITWSDLEPNRSIEYETTRHYTDPFTALGQGIVNVGGQAVAGAGQLFYAPHKGLGNIVLGLPKAAFDTVGAVQEGLDNMPGMMGGRVRRRPKVDSLQSGVVEGARGLAYGIADGVTGLVTQPYDGAKKKGLSGFVDGTIKSWVNLAVRPAGGALGLVVHPAAGAFRGAQAHFADPAGAVPVLAAPRQAQSLADAKSLGKAERRSILEAWDKAIAQDEVARRRKAEDERSAAAEAALLVDEKLERPFWPLSNVQVARLFAAGGVRPVVQPTGESDPGVEPQGRASADEARKGEGLDSVRHPHLAKAGVRMAGMGGGASGRRRNSM